MRDTHDDTVKMETLMNVIMVKILTGKFLYTRAVSSFDVTAAIKVI
jgi:hypothetical protein